VGGGRIWRGRLGKRKVEGAETFSTGERINIGREGVRITGKKTPCEKRKRRHKTVLVSFEEGKEKGGGRE